MMTIKAMTPPIMTISSVDPISETPAGWGVVVDCSEKAVAERSPCVGGGIEYVNAPLKSARIKPMLMMMACRTSFFISFLSISRADSCRILSSICTCICFCSIMPALLAELSNARGE